MRAWPLALLLGACSSILGEPPPAAPNTPCVDLPGVEVDLTIACPKPCGGADGEGDLYLTLPGGGSEHFNAGYAWRRLTATFRLQIAPGTPAGPAHVRFLGLTTDATGADADYQGDADFAFDPTRCVKVPLTAVRVLDAGPPADAAVIDAAVDAAP